MKYLGLTVDNKLKFVKCFQENTFLWAYQVEIDNPDKHIIVYKTIIAPDFDYCSSVLFLSNSKMSHCIFPTTLKNPAYELINIIVIKIITNLTPMFCFHSCVLFC